MTTAWPRVVDQCRKMDVEFDGWQHGVGYIALGKRANGKYAATIGGIVLSIPRQVGKTFLVGMILIALCIIFPGFTVLWTAHRTKTATKAFGSFQGMVRRKKVWPHVLAVRTANGEQEIRFRNGSVIMFGAREQGFGRGFDQVDAEVFDEAQILTLKALEDMVAATNQSRHPHGALLFFMGTPPRPVDNGAMFTERRKEALAHCPDGWKFGDVVVGGEQLYVECSADQDADPDDQKQWRLANPSFPHRTPLMSMLRLRANLPDVGAWMREALGVWDADDTQDGPISHARWGELVDGESMATDDTLRLGMDAPLDRRSACFSVFGRRSDRLRHVAIRYWLAQHQLGQLVEIAVALSRGHGVAVHVPPKSPALAWRDDLVAAGVEVVEVKPAAFHEAQQMIEQAVADGLLRHRGQPEMNAAVKGLAARVAGDTAPWSRRSSVANVAPLFAAAAAAAMSEPDAKRADPFFFV